MHSLFPNAILISDQFHFALHPRNVIDKTKIKSISKHNPDYIKEVTQKYIVTYLLHKNFHIYYSYNYYRGI